MSFNYKKIFGLIILSAIVLTSGISLVFRQRAVAQTLDPAILQQAIQQTVIEQENLLEEMKSGKITQKELWEIGRKLTELKIQQTKYEADLKRAKRWDFMLLRAWNIAYKNALRTFLSRLAFDSATRIAEGGWGKSPLFSTKNLGDFVSDVYQTTLADTLDILAKDNGYFNFDVCQPEDINLSLAINYSLFGNFGGRGPRGAPRCTFRQISERWDKWLSANFGSASAFGSSEKFLKSFKGAFEPTQTDVGIYLTLDSSIRSRLLDEKTKQMFDYLNNRGIKPITEPITRFIKTPVTVNEAALGELGRNEALTGSEKVRTGDIIADAIGIFTNTLAAKMMKKLFEKGLTEGQRAQSTIVYNWANQQLARSTAAQTLATLAEVTYSSGQERILDYLTQCPDSSKMGPNDCVMESKLVGAIEQNLTVREALLKGLLRGNWLVGYKPNGNLTFTDGYPYRSLVILRINRILPVGWELAAQYAIKKGVQDSGYTATLQHIVDCYEDMGDPNNPRLPDTCRENMDGDNSKDDDADYNPYYHLIDPNWVLKAPEVLCAKKGFGPEIVSTAFECNEDNNPNTRDKKDMTKIVEGPACNTGNTVEFENSDEEVVTVSRSNDYCADRKTCILDDGAGNCNGDYGYCLKEKDTWNFPGGKMCQEQFSSCETLTRTADGKQFSYIRDTLKDCDVNSAGCLWYANQASRVLENAAQIWKWQPTPKIYLNDQAENCSPTDGGCTKLSRLLPGTNAVFNGDFRFSENGQMPDGWTLTENRCQISYDRDASAITVASKEQGSLTCLIENQGFIPLDSRFAYTLSVALMSPDRPQIADVGLRFYGDNKQPIGEARYDILDQDASVSLRPGSSWSIYKGEVNNIPTNAKYAKVLLAGPVVFANADKYNTDYRGLIVFDSVQLVITNSPIVRHNVDNFSFDPQDQTDYQTDYSHNESYGREYLKVPPAYLGCEGYNDIILDAENDTAGECLAHNHYWRSDIGRCAQSGDRLCQNYAAVCKDTEIGCQGYKPLSGDPEVSGITTINDVCPAACVGFNSYLESPTYFDQIENPDQERVYQNFIPNKALSCSAADAGCEEFTNTSLGQEKSTNATFATLEQKEYFSYLRQCVLPNNPSITFYYTWEGSDTTGYQLKKWSFLRSNLDNGPCTNMRLGTEECNDIAENQAVCNAQEAALNPDCRDFFNRLNNHFWRLQSRGIVASESCSPYRRTATGQVYNADPGEGKSCALSANGCREYHGNQGNNIRNVITDNFESQTVGEWQNSAGGVEGLSPSNEAVERGGHSLLVSNNVLTRILTNQVKAGKQYTLSFWAKKAGAKGSKADIGTRAEQLTALDFSLNAANLNNNWSLYNLGPVELNSISQLGAVLQLTIDGLSANEVFYIDNIILKEYTSNFYAIKDSWLQTTPAECTLDMLGCQQYADRDKKNHFLKSFTSLCSSSAIGCEAYFNTQNSSDYQSEKVYNTGVCNADVGAIENGNCVIRGKAMCRVGENGECNYEVAKVPNDELVYLVNDSTKQCVAEKQGCSFLGQPSFDRRVDDYNNQGYISSYANVYKINNPDLYATQLCSESGLFCARFNRPVSWPVSSNKTFYDPQASSSNGVDSSQTCYYSGGKWYKSGSNNSQLCYENAGQFLPPRSQYNYNNLVGLCPSGQSTCTEYRDPQNSNQENPGAADVEQCDSRIAPQLRGLCVVGQNGATLNGDYCKLTINGVDHNVCNVNYDGADEDNIADDENGDGNGTNDCFYSASDWICKGNQAAYDEHGILIEGTGYCKVADKKVCYIPDADNLNQSNQPGVCSYSLLCNSSYYLSNSFDKATACTTVDRQAGCMLFNNTSNPVLDKSNSASENGAAPSSGNSSAVFGDINYQDANLLMQVKKDRQCGEWLECRTGFEQAVENNKSEFICLDLYRCSKIGASDKKCEKIISTSEAAEWVYDLSPNNNPNATEVNKIANLSGFSHPGLSWNGSDDDGADIIAAGYVSPEQMTQVGQVVLVINGGFETYKGNDLTKPEGWDDITNPERCSQMLDQTPANVHSGHYSLKVGLNNNDNQDNCHTLSEKRYPINRDQNYNLSFYAKSENNGQSARVGFAFNVGNNTFLTVNPPEGRWQKYILSIGQNTIPQGAIRAKIYFTSHIQGSSQGNIWYDDFQIEPVLNTGASTITKECRLYPAEDSTSCSYQTNKRYEGWQGYCLEPDPANSAQCLQWYPVDSLLGDRLSVFNVQKLGYADRAPLYYCAQTSGKYNYRPDNVAIRQTKGYKYQSQIDIRFNELSISRKNEGDNGKDCNGEEFPDPDFNIALCIEDNYHFNWEAGCAANWGCPGRDQNDCTHINNNGIGNGQHCKWDEVEERYCRDVIWDCNFNLNDCETDEHCIWGANGVDRCSSRQWSCSGLNINNCQADNNCVLEHNVQGSCLAKKTNVECEQYPANACPNGCVYKSPFLQNNNAGYLGSDYQSVMLEDIGSIYWEFGSQQWGGFQGFKSGFLSDITDQLDSAEYLQKDPQYYSKFNKVFQITEGDKNRYGLVLAFGSDPEGMARLLRFELSALDQGDRGQGSFNGRIYYYLKDQCSLIAQTVKVEGGVVKEKIALNKFNSGEGNDLGYSKNLDPSPYGGFYTPRNTSPEYWSAPVGENNRKDAPLYVYNRTNYDFPPAGVPWSVPQNSGSERICVSSENNNFIGKPCLSSADCGSNGVCGGIGGYCYKEGVMNGKACYAPSDCPDGYACQIPNLPASRQGAIERLQSLFAKVYGVWQWNQNTGQYETFNMDNLNLDVSQRDGTAPQVENVSLFGGESAGRRVVRNVNRIGVVSLSAPGNKVELHFTVNGSPDQLPLEGIWINWNDGNVDFFKGPFNYKPNFEQPFKAYHVYTCYTNDRGDKCIACAGGVNVQNGACAYSAPQVNVKDHWDWCAAPGANGAWVNEASCNPASGVSADKNIIIQ